MFRAAAKGDKKDGVDTEKWKGRDKSLPVGSRRTDHLNCTYMGASLASLASERRKIY